MLVFVSPKSAGSSWIYFESGFAYSKGINVIPIGICGIDIGHIKPPLNLLQGFNISNKDGIGNLVTVINREFDTDFDQEFSESEYSEIAILDEQNPAINSSFLELIDYVYVDFQGSVGAEGSPNHRIMVDDPVSAIRNLLKANNVDFYEQRGPENTDNSRTKIYSPGMLINYQVDQGKQIVEIKIDPYSLHFHESLVSKLPSILYGNSVISWCAIKLNDELKLVTDKIKLSARLHNAGHEMSGTFRGFFEIEGCSITTHPKDRFSQERIYSKERIHLIFKPEEFKASTILKILDKLIQANVVMN